MVEKAVPVTMGSPRFATREVASFRVTDAWFPAGASLPPHIHERPTFAVMLSGGFDLVFTSAAIRQRTLSCPPGTISTEPAGEKHANVVAREGARVVVVQPEMDAEQLGDRGLALLDRINHFRHGRIVMAAHRLAREIRVPDDLTPLSIEALALEMFVEAARLDDGDRWLGSTPAWMDRAIEYIHENFRAPLRIADVAAAAGVHPAHLAATFREVHRMPLGTYMRRLRVQWAADRLARSDEPIAAIAFRAGFADQAHLTRAFKRETGWTPARYRRALRG